MKILKVIVLLLSVAGASLVVWNATRDKKAATKKDEITAREMIGSSKSKVTGLDLFDFESDAIQYSTKSGPIIHSEDIAKMVEDKSSEIKITDEEVKKTRAQMMMSSKLGFVMSEEEVRKMLEERLKEEEKAKVEPAQKDPSKVIISDEEVKRMRDMMMSTSKSGRIMSDDKIREMLEEQKKESEKKAEPVKPEPHLMHSSKRIDSILDSKDLKQIVEGDKKQPDQPQESSAKDK